MHATFWTVSAVQQQQQPIVCSTNIIDNSNVDVHLLKTAISMVSVTDLTKYCVCILNYLKANTATNSFKSREGFRCVLL